MHKGGWDEILMYEINCKEVVKVYIDGGRAVTTMNI
jgi:hypothetical protein